MDAAWSTLRSSARPRVRMPASAASKTRRICSLVNVAPSPIGAALWEGEPRGQGSGRVSGGWRAFGPFADATRRVPSHWAGSRVSRT